MRSVYAVILVGALALLTTSCKGEKAELDPAPVGGTCASIGGEPCACADGTMRCSDHTGKCLCDDDTPVTPGDEGTPVEDAGLPESPVGETE